MSILYELPEIMRRAEKECENLLHQAKERLAGQKVFRQQSVGLEHADSTDRRNPKIERSRVRPLTESKDECMGQFVIGDNAEFLAAKIADGSLRQTIDLIYIDPPFFSQTEQGARIEIKSPIYDEKAVGRISAYSDVWKKDMHSYLKMIAVRLMLMKMTLKSTGSIFVHLDWHAVHAVKLIMDEIFGAENFVNEIIWTYKSGGAAKRHYSRKHDTILFYGKTERYKFRMQKEKSYNRGLRPYRFKDVKEFQDEIGWYTMVNQKDVWQIDMVGRSSGERLNYATQKPEALLARIIDAVTDEGDLAADFFCGSGTLAAVAAEKKRRFLCTDISSLAIANAMKRPLRKGCPLQLLPGVSAADFPETDSAKADIKADFGKKHRITAVKRDDIFELLDYAVDFSDLPLQIKEKGEEEKWKNLLKKDPMAFIDYWGVGTLTADGSFMPCETVFRRKNGGVHQRIDLSAENRGDGINGRRLYSAISSSSEDEAGSRQLVFAADIFGNIVFTEPSQC